MSLVLPKQKNVFHWRRLLPWLAPGLFLVIFFFYPLIHILWTGLNPASITGLGPESLRFSLQTLLFTIYQALLSVLLTLGLGLPAAYLFGKYVFWGKSFLRLLTAIPFMLPTVVVAAGFNAFLGPRGWINLGLMDLFHFTSPPIPFVGTFGAILLAHVFYNTTIVIRLVANGLSHLDPRLEQAARTLGAGPGRVYRAPRAATARRTCTRGERKNGGRTQVARPACDSCHTPPEEPRPDLR